MRTLPGLVLCVLLFLAPSFGAEPEKGIQHFAEVEEIATRDLADPMSAGANTYLDLETGDTFTYGESNPSNLLGARQWIREHGVDVMCESREPVKGIVAYDMAIHETHDSIDTPRDLDDATEQLKAIDAERMNFITAGELLPHTFLFRTREDNVGVLEIGAKTDSPPGYRVRVQMLKKFPPPIPMSVLADQLRKDNALLDPFVIRDKWERQRLQQRVGLVSELIQISQSEKVPKIASMKMRLEIHRYQLEGLKKILPPDATQLVELQKRTDAIEQKLNVELAKYKMPQLKGMAPITLLPRRATTTQPAGN